jgi:hypothetical protein
MKKSVVVPVLIDHETKKLLVFIVVASFNVGTGGNVEAEIPFEFTEVPEAFAQRSL